MSITLSKAKEDAEQLERKKQEEKTFEMAEKFANKVS